MTLKEAAEQYVKQQNSPNTQQAYASDLHKWFAYLGNRTLSVALIVAWKEQIEHDYAPSSARRIFASVAAFYDWLRRGGVIKHNLFEMVKRPRILEDAAPKVPTDLQVERILRAVNRSTPSGKRHYTILTLLLNGLRAQEVCDLRRQDFYQDEQTGVWVVRVVGKGMRERTVPLTHEAHGALLHYLFAGKGQKRKPTDFLLQDIFDGQPITRKQVAYVCRKYGELAGVYGFTPHAFRHHYATRLYRASRDVLGVGKLLGHRSPTTTQRYARLDLVDLVETARLDPRGVSLDETEYDAQHEAG